MMMQRQLLFFIGGVVAGAAVYAALTWNHIPGQKPLPDWRQLDRKQLERGIEVESEHTTNPKVARSIAAHHLAEIPTYYDWLDAMEANAKLALAKA